MKYLASLDHCACLGLREEKGFKFHSFKLPFCYVCQVNNDWHPEVLKHTIPSHLHLIFAVSDLTEEKETYRTRAIIIRGY